MGSPAARFDDYVKHDAAHCHAPIHPPAPVPTAMPHPPQPIKIVAGCATVHIGGRPAARMGDMTARCFLMSCVPAGPGTINHGSASVIIGGKPAARVGDRVAFPGCVAPIPSPYGSVIAPGCPTVTIGG